MNMTPWKYKAGVELTFQPRRRTAKSFREWSDSLMYGSSLEDKVLRVLRNRIPEDFVWRFSTDPDCFEIPTRPMISWADSREVINTILNEAKWLNLLAKNKGLSTGGGGHVHLGVSDQKTKCAIVRDMQNRPYIPWFFSDPDSTTQCNSIEAYTCSLIEKPWSTVKRNFRGYCYSPKFSHSHVHYLGTMEFRFFDCFMDYAQYEESLAFSQAYCAWIDQRVHDDEAFEVHILHHSDVLEQYNDYDRCLMEFKNLIKTLKLPWRRYEHYAKNLDERFTDIELLQ